MLVMSDHAGPKLLENMGLFLKNVETIEFTFAAKEAVKVRVVALVDSKDVELLYQLTENTKACPVNLGPGIGIYAPYPHTILDAEASDAIISP